MTFHTRSQMSGVPDIVEQVLRGMHNNPVGQAVSRSCSHDAPGHIQSQIEEVTYLTCMWQK